VNHPFNPAAMAGVLVSVLAATSAQAAVPTDPQIAAIVFTTSQVDIDADKLALSKAKSLDVKAFAQLMIDDHSGVNEAATELVQRLHVTPEANSTSHALQEGGAENLAALKALSGSTFDRAYLEHEIAYHQAVLDAVDTTLTPNAQHAELKALLVKVRPAFVAHLEHAKHLQSQLGKE
jgi:putative membrane protein